MKRFNILAITANLSLSAVTANAAPIPRKLRLSAFAFGKRQPIGCPTFLSARYGRNGGINPNYRKYYG